jgi:DNA-binding PadR family transcriptional regulator
MILTPSQLQLLRDMASDPNGENPYSVSYGEVRPLETQRLVKYVRTTRWAKINVYRITDKGKKALLGAESP